MKLTLNGKPISFFYRLPPEERELAEKQIKEKARGTRSFYVMMIISTVIVSAGLIADNAAVVIGGMIIAPVIWPILALAISIVHWHKRSLRKNLITLIISLGLALLISFLLGLIYPSIEFGNEVLFRTEPNVIDLIIALAAGLGGAFATVYTRRSPTIFGVAVAVALVPPLCTVGILLGNADFDIVGGALLLFLTNLIAILLAAFLVFIMAKFSEPSTKEGMEKRNKAIIYALVSFIIISLPLAFLTWNVVDLAKTRNQTTEVFNELFTDEELKNLQIVKTSNTYTFSGDIYSANNLSESKIDKFTDILAQRFEKEIHAHFTVIDVDKLNSFSK